MSASGSTLQERAGRGVDGRHAVGGEQPVVGGVGAEREQLGEVELWHDLTLGRLSAWALRATGWPNAVSTSACSAGDVAAAWGWIAPSATSSGRSTMRTSGLNGNSGAIDGLAVGSRRRRGDQFQQVAFAGGAIGPIVAVRAQRADVHRRCAPINSKPPCPQRRRSDPRQQVDRNAERRHEQHRADVHVARVRRGLDAEAAALDAEADVDRQRGDGERRASGRARPDCAAATAARPAWRAARCRPAKPSRSCPGTPPRSHG